MHRIARLSVEARHAWALGYLSGLNNESETLRPLWQMDRTGRLGLDGQLVPIRPAPVKPMIAARGTAPTYHNGPLGVR